MSNKSDHDLIVEIWQVLKDPDCGVCQDIKALKGSVNGNGKIGLKTQVLILWGVVLILLAGGQETAATLIKAVVK